MSISQPPESNNFDRHGWPLNPTTGRRYTRDEIVTNPDIPYPEGVDTSHPYWRRRTPEQLAAQKSKRNKQRRKTRTLRTTKTWRASQVLTRPGFFAQQDRQARATADLIDRANDSEPEARSILVTCQGYTTGLEVN